MGRDVGGGGGSSVGRRGAAWTTLAVLGGQATRLTPWNGIEIRLSSFARYNLVRFASIPSSYFSAAAAAADSDAERRPRISRVKHTNTNTTHTRGRAKKQKKNKRQKPVRIIVFFLLRTRLRLFGYRKRGRGGRGGVRNVDADEQRVGFALADLAEFYFRRREAWPGRVNWRRPFQFWRAIVRGRERAEGEIRAHDWMGYEAFLVSSQWWVH